MKIAVLGIGLMGFPIARRLCEAGHSVVVWNRTSSKAEALRAHGALVAPTPADAVEGVTLAITMLENGDAVEQVLFEQGAAAHMPDQCLVVDMSSIRPAQAQDHAQRLRALGKRYLDAPVSGGTVGAEAGTLAIMVGGSEPDHAQAAPVLACLGRTTLVGPHGSGQYAKLANQMIVGVTIAAVAEALLLAQRGGADMARVRDAIRGGFAESRVLEVHGQRMVDRDFIKRAAIDVQLKDLRNALQTASVLDATLPVTSALEALYAGASGHGHGDLDQAAVLLELERALPTPLPPR